MKREHIIRELICLAYDAAGDPNKWATLLDRVGALLRSPVSTLYFQDLRHQSGHVMVAQGVDTASQLAYERYYASKNIFLMEGRHLLVSGAVCTGEMMCPDRKKVLHSEFFQDYIRPRGLGEQGLNGVIYHESHLRGMIGFIREKGARGFSDTDLQLLQALVPHLQRAVRLQHRILELEVNGAALVDATILEHGHDYRGP